MQFATYSVRRAIRSGRICRRRRSACGAWQVVVGWLPAARPITHPTTGSAAAEPAANGPPHAGVVPDMASARSWNAMVVIALPRGCRNGRQSNRAGKCET